MKKNIYEVVFQKLCAKQYYMAGIDHSNTARNIIRMGDVLLLIFTWIRYLREQDERPFDQKTTYIKMIDSSLQQLEKDGAS